MAQITINEISQNYSYTTGNASFCSVALPITACWGPGYEDPAALGTDKATELETITWNLFKANQAGLESFVATYRGPASNYRSAKDYSYQMAMTLLVNGYDVLVCRMCPGTHAQATVTDEVSGNSLTLKAKYAGTFGNNLLVQLSKVVNHNYWSAVTYVIDTTGTRTAVENIVFAFDIEDSTDSILHVSEVESRFINFVLSGNIPENADFGDITSGIRLGSEGAGNQGTDRAADGTAEEMMNEAINLAQTRFNLVASGSYVDPTQYIDALTAVKDSNPSISTAAKIRYNEWIYTAAMDIYDMLKDKLAYAPARIISPWDDQNISELTGEQVMDIASLSPLHVKLMDIAYVARCATAYLDIPKSLPRSRVYDESPTSEGYAQKLSRFKAGEDGLYSTHSALFAPWGQYQYAGTSKQSPASPSFLVLLIQRAMILNQSLQYEWAMPTSRSQNVNVGKLDYTVPQRVLDVWQSKSGVGVNVITTIPDLGTTEFGNYTLFELPPATYQALANLSTRLLVNALKNLVYRCSLAINMQYNNSSAYSSFYAGVTPLLDTMRNVGAIDKYDVQMAADLNALDQINANSVLGTIRIWVNGVIDEVTVDLITLPVGVDVSSAQ